MPSDTENPNLDNGASALVPALPPVTTNAAPKPAREPRAAKAVPAPKAAPAPKGAASKSASPKAAVPYALAGSDGNGDAAIVDIPVTVEDMAAADLLVETLGGMAQAASEPQDQDWYVLVQQVEMVEQSVGGKKKQKNLAPKLARQIGKSVDLLQALFAQSSSAPTLLSDNHRAITRFLALLEVDLPDKKSAQRVYADILKNERRALAKSLGTAPDEDPLD